jgi:hypothetical protein
MTMKKIAVICLLLGLVGCGDKAGTKSVSSEPASAEPTAAVVVQPKKAVHYYSVEDGGEYGYEPGVSQDDQHNGTGAKSLIMFRYAGLRDAQYQVYSKYGPVVTALQCENPCEFIKIMTFYNGTFVKKEMLRATEGTIGWLAISDAINGFMKAYVAGKQGKEYSLHFDEKHGVQKLPADQSET